MFLTRSRFARTMGVEHENAVMLDGTRGFRDALFVLYPRRLRRPRWKQRATSVIAGTSAAAASAVASA
jgi:hypothetical protein